MEILAQSTQILLQQDKRITDLEEKIRQIEAKAPAAPQYYTASGYGALKGFRTTLAQASKIGSQAKRLCNERGVEISTTPDQRFGKINLYPDYILDEVFSRMK